MSRAQSPSHSRTEDILLSIQNQLASLSIRLDKAEEIAEGKNASSRKNWVDRNEPLISEDEEEINSGTFLKAKEAIGTISEFDGSNCENFIAQIEQARKITVRGQHHILLRFILAQKLKGTAKGSVRVDMIQDYGSLFDRLRFQFGEKISLDSVKMEIRNCRQKSTESLDTYIGRYVKLVDTARLAIYNGTWPHPEMQLRQNILAEEALTHFIGNLPERLYVHVNSRNPNTLSEAIQLAKRVEMELAERRNHGELRGNSFKPTNPRPFRKPEIRKPIRYDMCNFCKRPGHKEEDCRKKKYQNFQSTRPQAKPPAQGITNFTSEEKPGHPENTQWYC